MCSAFQGEKLDDLINIYYKGKSYGSYHGGKWYWKINTDKVAMTGIYNMDGGSFCMLKFK